MKGRRPKYRAPKKRPPRPPYVWAPEEKAAQTDFRLIGRSTIAQQSLLATLGVPREKSVTWTKYHAAQEITKRLKKHRAAQSRQPLTQDSTRAHAGAPPG